MLIGGIQLQGTSVRPHGMARFDLNLVGAFLLPSYYYPWPNPPRIQLVSAIGGVLCTTPDPLHKTVDVVHDFYYKRLLH